LLSDRYQTRSVIDIGSNSIRLVIFDISAGYPHPIYNERVFCALGAGVGIDGKLAPDTIDMALAAIVRFARVVDEADAGPLRIFATSAVRDASNGDDLVAAVLSRTGTSVDVITGNDEARLAAHAVGHGLNQPDCLVADLGGGSLELARLSGGQVKDVVSLPVGVVRLTAKTGGDMKAMRTEVGRRVENLDWLRKVRKQEIIPLGGAFRAFARLNIAETRHPLGIVHGYSLPAPTARKSLQVLAGMGERSLSTLDGVSSKRRAALPLTAMILETLMDRTGAPGLTFSAAGVREGYVLKIMKNSQKTDDPLVAGVRDFAARQARFGDTSDDLMTWLSSLFAQNKESRTRLQLAACALSDIAWREHPDYRARYAFDRAIQHPFLGLFHADRAFIALAIYIRYGGRADADEIAAFAPLYSKRAVRRAEILGLALRLAYRISGGNPALLGQSRLKVANRTLSIKLPANGGAPDMSAIRTLHKRICDARKLKPGPIAAAGG
jgi:exopolyphosphatase/guanosine-5'-triphosphate,3'-diphosphate pyrophosphatase